MPHAVAYVRVSSRAQDHATQKAAIERAAAARGDKIDVWFAEKKSAKTMAREELRRLLAQVRAGDLRGRRVYLFRLGAVPNRRKKKLDHSDRLAAGRFSEVAHRSSS